MRQPQVKIELLRREQDLEGRWSSALEYLKRRSPVVFISNGSYWEPHGFVQQSLAYALSENGVRVVWLNDADWRARQATIYRPNSNLVVKSLPRLPLRRISFMETLSDRLELTYVLKELSTYGEGSFVWIQSGVSEAMASGLPHVDVYSVFDDPYSVPPDGALAEKAKVIYCQNPFATRLFSSEHPEKTFLQFPPLDFDEATFDATAEFKLPSTFPEKRMGYIGSLHPEYFDFEVFSEMVNALSDWGFVLTGGTSGAGREFIRQLSHRTNFYYHPWMPREKIAPAWRSLDVCLLLYRSLRTQDGGFPTKVLEAMSFGVPSVATVVPKTEPLEGVFPRGRTVYELIEGALRAASSPNSAWQSFYEKCSREMDPRLQICRAVERVRASESR